MKKHPDDQIQTLDQSLDQSLLIEREKEGGREGGRGRGRGGPRISDRADNASGIFSRTKNIDSIHGSFRSEKTLIPK